MNNDRNLDWNHVRWTQAQYNIATTRSNVLPFLMPLIQCDSLIYIILQHTIQHVHSISIIVLQSTCHVEC